MADTPSEERETAQRVGLSLYPKHIRTIRRFAQESGRTDSNAAQYIIEDWERQRLAASQAALLHPEAAA